MIIKKSWVSENHKKRLKDYYTGWFLIGLIPLYLVRERKKMVNYDGVAAFATGYDTTALEALKWSRL